MEGDAELGRGIAAPDAAERREVGAAGAESSGTKAAAVVGREGDTEGTGTSAAGCKEAKALGRRGAG